MPEPIVPPKSAPTGKRDSRAQLARVRRICLSIPGTTEKLSHGEPTFFTPKKVFAMFANDHHGDGHIAVWLPAAEGVQSALIEEAPDVYFRPPYVGASGWVGVELSKLDDAQLGSLVREAFRLIDLKATPMRRAKSAPPSAPRRNSRKEKHSAS
ncbi:MAG: MmcQ/YjbR family DNA-binding protein [Bryobacterales bacterium]|nr:MmcQ/YjbR family DNA-binding protein [Bryobacterales bacterium]MBV9398357.1 MmcQ/YjbR family DNA-binding protein [Bryobacterales bacterium]